MAPLDDQRTTVYKVDPEHPETQDLPILRTEELLLNMGPQHPATHGVLKVILELEGERITKSTVVMGFLHRGVEKLAEDGTYHQFIPHTDRLDYVCAMYNNFAYCRAVEKLMDMTIPDRAEYLRTIVAEIQRIIGHLFWLGTQALDIGAMTVFFYTFRDREILLDWFDELCGARLTTSWYRIGGVERDFTHSLEDKIRRFLDYFPPKIEEYIIFLEKNRIWLARTQGVAVITAEDALSFGLSGPTLRGSGVDYDLRKYESYGAYPKCEFSVPIGKNGDTYDRYWIRIEEMRESIKIIRQCVQQIPEGSIRTKTPFYVRAPIGDTYAAIEGPKGELGFYIVSDGGTAPYRCKVRAPSLMNLTTLREMLIGWKMGDLITIFGSIDIVLGEVDR